MAFELDSAVPWGRNLKEYQQMFLLSDKDLDQKIISFGDGPASFNSELNNLGKKVISIDLIYKFSEQELKTRFEEVKRIVMPQVRNNLDNFTWRNIKNPDTLELLRGNAMSSFLKDFTKGKKEGRYRYHELPNKLEFKDQSFPLGLSSHFLLLYSNLGTHFHIQSLTEMLRICKEVRVFPILNLDSKKSEVLDEIVTHFKQNYKLYIQKVNYEFQKNGNQMLVIKHQN